MAEHRTFTEDEQKTINSIYARNCEDLTADEVQLLIAWECEQALQSAEYQAEKERLDALAQAEIAAREAEHLQAMENLAELHRIALARLETIRGKNVS